MRLANLWVQSRLDGSIETPIEHPDIEAFGGDIAEKDNNVVRLAVHNTNGFHSDRARKGAEEIDAMETLGIDLLGLTETNVNWKNELKNEVAAWVRLAFGTGSTVMASAPSNAKHYLPGGVAMMAKGKIEGRITRRVPDSLGRYTYMALKGKTNTGILVVTVYRVCQKKGTKTGPDTAYMQQHVAMREAGIKNPDLRKKF